MDHGDEQPDQLTRGLALLIAAGRIVIGIGAGFVTRPALRALGFEHPGQLAIALARLAGWRDIALGAHALAANGDRERLREATLLGAAVDAGDAAAFVALGREPEGRATALRNAPLAAAAAIAGIWVYKRL